MKKFRIRSGVVVVIIMLMVIVAGCGKGASSTDDVKPDKDTTAVEEKNDTKEDEVKPDKDTTAVEEKNDTKEDDVQAEVPENDDTVLDGYGDSFDASAYVKALMDNSYKGDSSAFVEQEVGTKEQAEKLYEEGIDTEMSGITTGIQLSDELQGEFRDVLKDVFKNVKYTVGDATKKDDAYEVEVKYQKMNVFAPAMETFQADSEAYVAEMTEKAASGEDTPSEEEINEKVYSMLKDAIKGAMGSVTYGDEESTTVRIELKDKVWTPNEDDLYNLELLLFDSEAVTDAAQ